MKSILMLIALSIGLLTANAAPDAASKSPIPIASLPIKITAAGSYYFISNMFYTPTSLSNSTAITINSPGNVTIDLKGYTLTGPPQAFAGGFYLNPSGIVILSSNVTIKNGTIAGFTYQISANPNTGQPPNYISNIDINSVTFTGGLFNTLQLTFVDNSLVRDCTFTESNSTAIVDGGSHTGNRYINDLFSGTHVNPIQMRSDAPIIVHGITPLQKNDED